MRIKKAFTLGEMILVFIIIGIISAMTLTTTKPWAKTNKYAYSRMYNALSLTMYNYMIKVSGEDAFPSTGDKLCKALLEYINTSNNATTCSGSNLGANPDSFPDNKVRIRASNGARIWIGANNGAPFLLNQVVTPTFTDKVRYYMVYVDLNGDRNPNTAVWSPNNMADIVAFIVTDKYKVLPIGYPEVDDRYFVAHVIYPTINDDYTGADDNAKYSGDEDSVSPPKTYHEAVKNAFGDNVFAGVYETYNFAGQLPNSSPFKVSNYNDHYTTPPVFDENTCAMETGSNEPVCTVKIYDYH